MKRFVQLVTLLAAVFLASKSEAWAEFQPPKIFPVTPEDYLLYQAGQTANFKCSGTLNPVTWILPEDASESMKRRVKIEHVTNHDDFTAILNIRDLNYTDTATLNCAYNGSTDLSAIDESTKIHLYVEDKNHLLKHSGFEFLQVVQSDTFILPCMPTRPDVHVSLWKQGRPVDNDQYISFDPKVGYRISPVIVNVHSGEFECKANYGGQNDTFIASITVRPKTFYVPPPNINTTLARDVMKGDTFTLICSVMVDLDTIVELTWITPNPKAIGDHRISIPDISSKNLSLPGTHLKVVEQQLTVLKATRDDQGRYTCTVTDHSGNTQDRTQFVQILEADQPKLVVWVEAPAVIERTIGDGNNEEVQWVVQIKSHPQPIVEWFGPDMRKIEDNPGVRHVDYTIKTYLERENARTMLRINKLKLANSGTYTVKITNGNLSETESFTLKLKSAPTVEVAVVNPQGLYNKGQEYSLRCSAEGSPIPRISWMFKPCQDFNECENADTVTLGKLFERRQKHQNVYRSFSEIREVARRSGQFICQACNSIQCIYDKTDFFVTDVPDGGFSISGPENVLEGEAISLKCSASRYNFSQNSIEWFKDSLTGQKKIKSNGRYHVHLTSTDFSFTKELKVNKVTLGDKGRYLCRVKHRHHHDQVQVSARRSSYFDNDPNLSSDQELSFKLNVLPLERPAFIGTNLLPEFGKNDPPMIIEHPEDGVELFCRVAGRPKPSISWYLNGAKLLPTLNNSRVQIMDDNQVVRISYVSAKDEGLYECKAINTVGSVQVVHMVQLRATAERDALYAQISVPVIVAVVIAIILVIVLIIIAKVCYMKRKTKAASVTTSTCPWKDPPTPPTPKLNHFELPLSTPPALHQDAPEDRDFREGSGSVSPFNSLRRMTPHPGMAPCCSNPPSVYGHCHYGVLPNHPGPNDPLLPCQALCECSLQTIPQGTLERQFPHLYSHNTLHHHGASVIYDHSGRLQARSHSVSPSRRSAEY